MRVPGVLTSVCAVVLMLMSTSAVSEAFDVSAFDVVWSDLLPNDTTTYVNTMPVGNGRLASLVWFDPTSGSVSLMYSTASAWNEAAEVMKVGLTNVTLSPNPFSPSAFFQQKLHLDTGTVTLLLGGSSNTTFTVQVDVYVNSGPGTATEALADLLVVDVQPGPGAVDQSVSALSVTVTNQVLRPDSVMFSPVFECIKYNVSADVVATVGLPNAIATYHRNPANSPYFSSVLQFENIRSVANSVADPLSNRTSGAVVFVSPSSTTAVGGGVVKSSPTTLQTTVPAQVGIVVYADIVESAAEWLSTAEGVAAKGIPSKAAHNAYWAVLWARSYIDVVSDFQVSQQATLQRYIQATQGSGQYPIRFNGMLFTANKPPQQDYRQWGGHNWWQNVRMPYYNMLPAGDGDMLLSSLLEWYNSTLELATQRTALYYPNWTEPAAFWPEYTSLFGTTHPGSYGCNRAGVTSPPIAYSEDRWNHYNNQGALDLSLFILDHYAYTSDEEVFTSLLPLITRVLKFYKQRFPSSDNGKMVLFPTQACETWQCPNYPPDPADCVTNDAPTVAGLTKVLSRLLQLPDNVMPPANKTAWKAMLLSVPALPVNTTTNALSQGDRLPPTTSNSENPELYPVHPYRLATTAIVPNSTLLTQGINALKLERFQGDNGWRQNAMDAALLGLATEAQSFVKARASTGAAVGYRFPAFSPHFQDYEPSADHLAVFRNALTWMLLQPVDDVAGSAVLLPAWPCSWDVNFSLWAPNNTRVTGELTGGRLTFSVDPPTRASAISARACQ